MMRDIVISPLIDLTWLYGLAGVAVIISAIALWRGLSGWAWRALGLMTLVVLLAQPSLRQRTTEPLQDVAVIIADRSTSQSIGPRSDQLRDMIDGLTTQLQAMGNLRVDTIELSDAPQDRGTQIFEALNRARADIPQQQLSSIFVISDGQNHDTPAEIATDVPLHHIITGTRSEFDRQITVVNAPAYAILGEPVSMVLRVDDMGQAVGVPPAEVSVLVDGQTVQTVMLPTGVDTNIDLILQHAGQTFFEFRVNPVDGELTTINNTAILSVNAVRDRLRVLLVSGLPHAGARVWRNLLKSDSSVDLVHFTILRPPEKQDGVPVSELSLIAFPTRELFMDKIDDFDLIIFDRYKRRGILPNAYLDNIASYVEKGGAVLFAAGPDFASAQSLAYTPLDRVLPARAAPRILQGAFTPSLTETGQRHPVTSGLSGQDDWGDWSRQLDLTVLRGETLMKGQEDHPLLILDRVGEGRVALLASDHVWLWYRKYQGGGPQQELLRRVAHWLMKEPDLEEETLSATQTGSAIQITRRSLRDTIDPVTLRTPSGQVLSPTLQSTGDGVFVGTVETDEQGVFEMTDGSLRALVAKGALSPIEYRNPMATTETLAPIVTASGGGQVWAEDGVPTLRELKIGRTSAGRGWLGVVRRGATQTLDITMVPALPIWAALLLSLFFIVGAWIREGRR